MAVSPGGRAGSRSPDGCIILAVWQSTVRTGSLSGLPASPVSQTAVPEWESSGRGGGNVMWKITCRTDTMHQFFLLLQIHWVIECVFCWFFFFFLTLPFEGTGFPLTGLKPAHRNKN